MSAGQWRFGRRIAREILIFCDINDVRRFAVITTGDEVFFLSGIYGDDLTGGDNFRNGSANFFSDSGEVGFSNGPGRGNSDGGEMRYK